MRHAPGRLFDRSQLRGRGCACRCRPSALSVIGGVVVVYVVAGRSLAFVGQFFAGCWPSLSPLRAVIEVLGGCRRFGWLDLFVVVWVV